MISGTAIRSTSSGNRTMASPLKVNMTTMVKSRAISVMGEITGRNLRSYHSMPLSGMRMTRLSTPAANGIPR